MAAHARPVPTLPFDAGLAELLAQYRAARAARQAARGDAAALLKAEDYTANVLAMAIDLRVGG